MSSKLSLINPDLSGLVNTIYFKKGKTTLFLKIGAILNWLCFLYPFAFGIPFTFYLIYLLFVGIYNIYTLILAVIVIYPFVFHVKPSIRFLQWITRYYSHYFDGNVTLSFMEDRINNSDHNGTKEILCLHPHAILTVGCTASITVRLGRLNDKGIPSLSVKHSLPYKVAIAPCLLWTPIYRYIVLMSNTMFSASKQSILSRMKQNKSFSLYPGAFYELSHYEYNKNIVVVPKGFIKYALTHGYKLTPSYCYGANKTYNQLITDKIGILNKIKNYLATKSIPFVIFVGKWWNPLLPKSNIGLHSIIGKSIQFPLIKDPSYEDIIKYQSIYIKELKQLFDENKWRFGMNNLHLKVIQM